MAAATDLETLVVQLSADYKSMEGQLKRATGTFNKAARDVEKRAQTLDKRLGAIGSNAARSLVAPLAGIGAALSIREVLRYADAWTKAKNSLAVAGVTGRQQKQVLDQLFAAAQRNSTPIGTLTDLYGKAALSADRLGASQKDLIRFADGIAVALRASGTSTEAASGALTQLGQALGAGTVRAEEFNSILEGAPAIARAVAAGLPGINGDIGKLRAVMLSGGLASKDFFNAFLRGMPAVQSLADNATQTIEQGVVRVTNQFMRYIGETDSSLGASQRLVGALNLLADNFDQTADMALKLAGIIAGALVGRAITGMIASLGLGATALVKFAGAMRAASAGRGLVTALGGLVSAAGPVGLVIGTAAAGAFEIYSANAAEAAARSERVAALLDRVGVAGHAAAEGVDAASAAQRGMPTAEELAKGRQKTAENLDEERQAVEKAKKDIDDVKAEIAAKTREVGQALAPFIQASFDEGEWGKAAQSVLDLAHAFATTGEETDVFFAKLDAVARAQPDFSTAIARIKALYRELEHLNEGLRAVESSEKAVNGALAAPPPNRRAGIAGDRVGLTDSYNKRVAEGQAGLAAASKEAGMSKGEKRLVDEMERLRKEIAKEHPNAIVSDAQIRTQAQRNLAAGDLNQTIDDYVNDVVRAESGGRTNAKNPNSSATGLGQFVTETWVRLFRANFPDRAKGLSDEVIAGFRTEADTSRALIEAYARENAAVLQKAGVSVDAAALQLAHFLGAGDAAKVLKAAPGTPLQGLISSKSIAANPTILGGGRTVDDAIAYSQSRVGQATPGAQRYEANQDFGAYLAQQQQDLEQLQQKTEFLRELGPLTTQNAAALLQYEKAQELLNDAQQSGSIVATEVHSANELLHGDLTKLSPAAQELAEKMRALALGYGTAQAAQDGFGASQEALKSKMDGVNELGRDALGTFISDLREGKSAAEALGDVLDRIADRLLDMALNALFPTGGGGGGLLGLIGIGGKKDGGIVHAAGGGRIRGPGSGRSDSIPAMLSNGEYVVNARATSQHRRLLDAINGGKALHLAAGAFVGTPSIPMARPLGAVAGPASMTIDVRGATGNAEIQRMVSMGVGQAISAYDRRQADGQIIRQRLAKAQFRF